MRTPSDDLDVPRFERDLFGSGERFTRIGDGALGGKARGLILIERILRSTLDANEFPGIAVGIPRMTVIATGAFDAFMEENALWDYALSGEPDRRIAHAFLRAALPVDVVGDLRGLIEKIHAPLAVRSSSLLEDALDHPFAGVYGTKMTPNNQLDADTRFTRLVEAVKFVYASTFFRGAVDFRRAIGKTADDEKMAVIVQEVVGARHGERFYPHLSGVGRSFNFYPSRPAAPHDGVVNLALGLGKTIVDGGVSWSFSPAHPKAPPPYNSARDLVGRSQLDFWAVNMGRPPEYDPSAEAEYLRNAGLAEAEADGTLRLVASTYDPAADRLFPGIGRRGARVLTFAPLLVLEEMPLARLVSRLLAVSRDAFGSEVEIEFAMTFAGDAENEGDRLDAELARGATSPPEGALTRFGFLQVRPMSVSTQPVEITAEEMGAAEAIVVSETVMGNAIDQTIRDIVYVAPDTFDAGATREIAKEIELMNESLAGEERRYVLIGFGRWGSQDPRLGIPVEWSQISGARAIVEATLPEMAPDPSQGSHFFHNITAFHVSYFTIAREGSGRIDWEWLARAPEVSCGRYVRHVRVASPLTVKIDGRRGAGVVSRAPLDAAAPRRADA